MAWPYEGPKAGGTGGIPRRRIEDVVRRKPSVPPFNYCEWPLDDGDCCGSRNRVFYDRELRLHLCSQHWSETPRPKPGAVSVGDVAESAETANDD